MTTATQRRVRSHDEPLTPPAPVEFVTTGVGEIAVRRTPVRGAGPHEPAVLVHGLGGNALNWVDLADGLADRLECVSLDLPGFGATEPLADADYSIPAHTAAVVATMEALFPGQSVHLFGNSMGGAISLQLAARRADLVRTLCLISPALPDLRPHLSNLHIPAMAVPGVGNVLFARYQKGAPRQRVQSMFDLCYADPTRLHPQRRAEAETEAQRRETVPWVRGAFVGSTQGLIATYLDRGPDRPWALAGRVAAPTLLVYGQQDKLVDAKAARRAAKEFRVAHVMVVPDCGHMAMLELPELVDRWWRERLGR